MRYDKDKDTYVLTDDERKALKLTPTAFKALNVLLAEAYYGGVNAGRQREHDHDNARRVAWAIGLNNELHTVVAKITSIITRNSPETRGA